MTIASPLFRTVRRRALCFALAVCVAAPVRDAVAQGKKPPNGPALDLALSPASITFASADPDVMPSIASAPVTVSIRVRQNDGPWELTVLANGDLISGTDSVDMTNVTWTATPAPPFQNGTVSKTVAQRLASGTGMVNPAQNGSLTFHLANSWTYAAGTYSQTLVFTLSAP